MPRSCRLALPLALAASLFLAASPSVAYEQEIGRLADELATKIASDNHRSIAVVDFTELDGNVTLLGRFLAEELSISLAENTAGLQVVDRQRLSLLLKEHKLSLSGLLEPDSIRRVGKIAGVGALVTGSLTPFGDSIRVSLKVLDVETATMIASGRGNIPKIGTIADLLGSSASEAQGPAKAQQPKAKVQSTEQNKLIFELQRCELTSQTIDCHLLINNRGKNRDLEIAGYSVLFDDAGNEYNVGTIQVANSTRTLDYPGRSLTKTLLYDIPVQASLTFRGISPQATRVGELKIVCTIERQQFVVSFRDISLEAKQVPSIQTALGAGSSLTPSDSGALSLPAEQQEGIGRGIVNDLRKEAREAAKDIFKKWRKKATGDSEK